MLRSASSLNVTPPTWPVAPTTAIEGRLAFVVISSFYLSRANRRLDALFYRRMALRIRGRRFLRHSRSDIRRWARSLEHVRFCHPADLQVFDREIFEVAIAIPETEASFVEWCGELGIPARRIRTEDPVARAGLKYSPEEWKGLAFPIPLFPLLAQPGEQTLAGAKVHIWIRGRFLEIVIAPDVGLYSVDEADYERAKAVDAFLQRPGLQFREPLWEDDSCVCPTHYPKYWQPRRWLP